MNKKLLTAAMAAAIAAPLATPTVVSADTTVYGRINNAVVYRDYGEDDTQTDGQIDVESNASRFGFKGSEDLGNGLKALFQMEFAVDTANGVATSSSNVSNRLGWAGLSGAWGTGAIGRQWTPYYGAVNKTDIFQMAQFNDFILAGTVKVSSSGTEGSIDNTTGRIGDAIAYVSPTFFGGLSASLAVIAASESDLPNLNEELFDVYNPAINWNRGGLSVGLSAMMFQGDDDNSDYDDLGALDDTQYGVSAKYTYKKMFAVIGQFESYDGDDSMYAIAGEYYFGNNTLRALYAYTDMDSDGLIGVAGSIARDNGDVGEDLSNMDKSYNTYELELQHNFSKRTLMYVSYKDSDLMGTSRSRHGKIEDEDGYKWGMGLRHDF
jgi:predicted porin